MKGPARVSVTITANVEALRKTLRLAIRMASADARLAKLVGPERLESFELELQRRTKWFMVSQGASPVQGRIDATLSVCDDVVRGRAF